MTLDQWMSKQGVTSDADLSDRLDVSRPYAARLRTGEKTPSLELASRWERELGIAAASWTARKAALLHGRAA